MFNLSCYFTYNVELLTFGISTSLNALITNIESILQEPLGNTRESGEDPGFMKEGRVHPAWILKGESHYIYFDIYVCIHSKNVYKNMLVEHLLRNPKVDTIL